MHPFCGTPVGQEGYGQPVLCPSCDGHAVKKMSSASPIVAAFDRVSTFATADPNLIPAIGTSADADSSSKEQTTEGALPSAHTNVVATTSSRRSTQIVSTVKQRVKVVQWLVEMERRGGIKGLRARAVDEFPEIFRSESRNSNLAKAASWWKKRETILNLPKGTRELSTRRHDGRMRANKKLWLGVEDDVANG
ncbi:hypothetical protein DVH05_026454 [Phytophthora capsici]|nr:hypothetical protein DVH05_027268 [Phytophthora capsici]KAG1707260.1 hypothetical protein DVH05_026454 [Phytophthora capsici]